MIPKFLLDLAPSWLLRSAIEVIEVCQRLVPGLLVMVAAYFCLRNYVNPEVRISTLFCCQDRKKKNNMDCEQKLKQIIDGFHVKWLRLSTDDRARWIGEVETEDDTNYVIIIEAPRNSSGVVGHHLRSYQVWYVAEDIIDPVDGETRSPNRLVYENTDAIDHLEGQYSYEPLFQKCKQIIAEDVLENRDQDPIEDIPKSYKVSKDALNEWAVKSPETVQHVMLPVIVLLGNGKHSTIQAPIPPAAIAEVTSYYGGRQCWVKLERLNRNMFPRLQVLVDRPFSEVAAEVTELVKVAYYRNPNSRNSTDAEIKDAPEEYSVTRASLKDWEVVPEPNYQLVRLPMILCDEPGGRARVCDVYVHVMSIGATQVCQEGTNSWVFLRAPYKRGPEGVMVGQELKVMVNLTHMRLTQIVAKAHEDLINASASVVN